MIRINASPSTWPMPIDKVGCILAMCVRRFGSAAQPCAAAGPPRQRRPRSVGRGQKYLPEHFRQPPSNMHRWLTEQLDAAHTAARNEDHRAGAAGRCQVDHRHARAAAAGGRRVLGVVPLDRLRHQAPSLRHLENIKAELLENQRLARDFPEAVGRGLVWRGNSIVLRNGVTIEAFGTGQRIRGRRRRQHRPTLILCDDLQNDGHIGSAVQREHSRSWFHGTLMKAGTAADQRCTLPATAYSRH